MIVVDTNVWSETLRRSPEPRVIHWVREHSRSIYMPVVTVHELKYGVKRLPQGQRRDELARAIAAMLSNMGSRILGYGASKAEAHAVLRATAERAGRTLSAEDGQILGIAAAHGASVATRNTADFRALGIDLIDPWSV